MLGDDTRIHVIEIVGNNVRLSIEAPKSTPVYREEIWGAVNNGTGPAAATECEKRPGPGRGDG